MDFLTDLLEKTSWKVVASIISILVLYLFRIILAKAVDSKVEHFKKRYFFRQTINYIFLFLLFLILVIIWVDWFRSVITLLSLVLGALVIASKEALLNILANAVIIWRGLFQVGDRIEIEGVVGDVIEAGPMYFTLAEVGNWVHGDATTGRIVKVPNSFVLYKIICNYSKGLGIIWNEVSFDFVKGVDIYSIKDQAISVIEQIHYKFTDDQVRELKESSTDIMFIHDQPEIFIKAESEKTVITIRYLTKFHKRRDTENHIQEFMIRNFSNQLK